MATLLEEFGGGGTKPTGLSTQPAAPTNQAQPTLLEEFGGNAQNLTSSKPAPKGLGTVARGVQAGGYETLGTLGGLAAMGGEALGLPEVQKAGLKYAGEQFQKAEELGQGIPTQIQDIKNVGDAAQYGLYTAGSLVPSVVLSATGAGLGVAGAKELAKKGIEQEVKSKLEQQITKAEAKAKAKGEVLSEERKALLTAKADKVIAKKLDKVGGLGGTAGIAATSIPQETGSIYAEQAQTGKTDVGAALTSGIAAGLLDTFSAHKMLSKFGLFGGKNLEQNRTRAKSLLGAVIKGGTTQAGIEGLTEGAQTFIEKLGVKYANPDLSLADKNAILDYLNSTIAGSIGGGTFGGIGGGLSYKTTTGLTGGKPLTEAPTQPTAPQAPQPQMQEQIARPQIAISQIHPGGEVKRVDAVPQYTDANGQTFVKYRDTPIKNRAELKVGDRVKVGKEVRYFAHLNEDGNIDTTTTPEEAQQYAAQQQQPAPTTVQPSTGLVMSAPAKAPVMGQVGGLTSAQRPSKPIPSLRGEELRATPTKQEPIKEPPAKENPELKKKFDTVKNLRARYDSQPNEFHGKALLRSIRELYNTKGISEPQKELYSKLYNEIQDEVISKIKKVNPKRKFGSKEFPPISEEIQVIKGKEPASAGKEEPISLTKEPTPATMKEPITEKGAGVEKYIAEEDNPVFMDWQKRQEIVRKAESGEELTPEEAASFGYTHDKAGLYNTTAYKRWVRQDKSIEKQPHLYMDLDNFKKYNDEYGHDFGDTLIKYVGERLSKISPTDRILGLGGDEFAAVHPDADVLNNIAEGLKKDLANAKFEIKNLKTGRIDIVKGLKLSHGVGKNFGDAKEVTSKEKEAKLLTGERYVRGTERKGAEFRKPQGTERPTREEGRVSDNGDNITGREKIPSRQATTEVGSPSNVTTPAGREIETVFIVKDINDIIPSHLAEGFPSPPVNPEYKGELQPRDRSKEAWLSVEEQSKKIDPRRMGDSPEASLGAPIIGKDNLVESGNGRTIALALAYKNNTADNYKKYLIDNAEKFGLTKGQVEAINEPILVRERQTKLSPTERKAFVEEANESAIAGKKTTEEAKIDASRLATLDKLDINEDGTFPRGSGFVKDFVEHVVPRNDRPQMSVEGELTQYGLRRIQNAIFAKAYGYNNITQKMMESTDNNIKNITNGMLKAAPDIAKLQADMEKGKLNEKLDIVPQLIKAINTYSSDIQSKNISYDQYSKQLDMFEKLSQDELDMVKSIYDRRKSGVQIADMLKSWVKRVGAEGNPKQAGLALEEVKPINKFDLFREVLDRLSGAKEQDIFARANIAKGGMDKTELEKGLEPLLALNKKRNLETKVLQSVEDLAMELPENGQRKVENLGGDISGFIYDHKIFIIADNIRSVKEGYKTLNHEVAHFGLRQVLNDKEFDRLLRQVWIAKNKDAKDIAELYKLDTSTEKGRLEAAEEVLAHLAETDANNTWAQKAVAIIARWLREHGIDIKLTDSEIREILIMAKNYDSHIKDKDKYSSLVDGRFQIVAYHGTDGAFQEFDERYISRNNALGYGFYFTDKKEITRKYGENLFDVILHEGKTPDQYDYMEYYQPISNQQASRIVDTANAYGIKEDMMARRLKRGVDLPTGEEIYRWLEEVGKANGMRDPFAWAPSFLMRAEIDGTVDTEPGRTVWCVFNSSNISIKNISRGVSGGRASLIGRTGAQELSSAHIKNLETAKKMEVEGAKNTAIYFATGWEKGVDGEWRMELDTDNFSLKYPFPNDKQVVSISDLIKFPELFKAYPNLKDMKVEFNQDILDKGNLAEFDPAENKINLSPALRNNLRNLKSTLLHEIQHWIQGEEGFALGTNITEAKDLLKASKKELKGLKPDEVYARAAGEVEARNVETRAAMLTAEERKQVPPSMTEDRKREQQLISMGIAPEIPNAKKLVEPTIEDEAYKQQNKVIKMARMSADTFPADAGYKRVLEIEAQRNNINEFLKGVSSGIDDASKFLGKFFSGIDESLGYTDERLKWRLRRFEATYRQGLTKDTTEIKPFLKALSLMKEGMAMRMENGKEKKVKIVPDNKKGMEDYLVLDFALKNGDMVKINEVVKKYGIEEEYKAIKPVLKSLLERAKEVGYEFGEIENYFPRAVKDAKGLVQHLRQMDGWSIIDKNIDEKSNTLKRNLTDEEILDVVATTLRGYKTGVSLPQLSNMKKRLYGKLKPDMNQYYHTAETSLMAYLERTHEGIATREFFGKANVKEGGVKDSIDQYVQQLRKEGKLSPSQEKEVIEILNSRFNYRQMNPFLSGYRNLEYIDTMGSPISAVTQIGDLAFSIYFNGHYTGKALLDAATNKERVTKYKAGIENITNEFTGQHNKMARAVNVVFKFVGLEKLDAIGKETFMNATVSKYRAMAKNPTKEFMDELELIMGNKKDADQLLKDLQEGRLTPLTETFAVLKLMDVQPLTLSQMPLKYIDSPNGRIFYMLKSYTIKQFNVFRKQCFDLIYEGSRLSASKDPQEKAKGQKMLLEGTKRMIALTSTLVFMGITTDFMKDWMLGRDTPWDDKVINNILKLIGLSKYTYFQAKQEGTSKALLMTILPPAKLMDNATKDMFEQKGIDKTIQSVPLVGSMFYWWMKHFREQ